jgi:hypothetical protein
LFADSYLQQKGPALLVFCRVNNYTYIHAAFFSPLFGFVHPGEISSNR